MRNKFLVTTAGLLTGVSFTVMLLSKRPVQVIAAVFTCVLILSAVYHIFKIQNRRASVILFAVMLIAGYLLCAGYTGIVMGRLEAEMVTPASDNDSAAILLLSPGEITEYNVQWAVYRQKVLSNAGYSDIKWWNMPLKAYGIRKGLKQTDAAVYTETNQSLYNKFRNVLGDEQYVYNANLIGPPHIETTVKGILEKGHKKIIIVNNLLIQGPYKEIMDEKVYSVIKKHNLDVEVVHTFPLWNHDAISSLYESRIMEKIQEEAPERVGIILVAKGCSKKELESNDESYNREEVFMNKIKENLIKNGYDGRKIKVAYLEYRTPDLKETIDYLLDSGVARLVVAAAGFESDCIQTEYIIPGIIDKARIPSQVDAEYVGCWGDSDMLVNALVDRLEMVNAE